SDPVGSHAGARELAQEVAVRLRHRGVTRGTVRKKNGVGRLQRDDPFLQVRGDLAILYRVDDKTEPAIAEPNAFGGTQPVQQRMQARKRNGRGTILVRRVLVGGWVPENNLIADGEVQ